MSACGAKHLDEPDPLSFRSEGGFFKAHLTFPKDYPQNPPEMRFKSSIFHPNGKPLPSRERLAATSSSSVAAAHFSVLQFAVLLNSLIGVAVYADGRVCISILHAPGDDPMGYEKAAERWLPVHTVETILVSVISMLSNPNDESPANVDAAVMWRENPAEFKKRVSKDVRRSQDEAFE